MKIFKIYLTASIVFLSVIFIGCKKETQVGKTDPTCGNYEKGANQQLYLSAKTGCYYMTTWGDKFYVERFHCKCAD